MTHDSSAKARIARTYAAASDHFDTLPFWHHFGRRTIERLSLAPGARVLDLCCGTGASALVAAEIVGPGGHVLGVDLSRELIAVARAKAMASGLGNIDFRVADVESLRLEPASFDAVVSVFGLFFIDDMAAMLQRAWDWLRPGGRLAVTTWGRKVLDPGESLFWDAVAKEDESIQSVSASERLADPEAVAALFVEAGAPAPIVSPETWDMPIATPEAFWPVILGTSNRAAFDALPDDARARVRAFVIETLRARRVTSLRCDVIYAVASRLP